MMRKQLINPQNLTRKLRLLSLLLALLLPPIGAWAQDTYDLWIGDTQVTSANASHLDDQNESGYATFDASTNTLTLNNFFYQDDEGTINGAFIKNGLGDLTINLVGQSLMRAGNPFLAKSTEGGENYTVTFTTGSDTPGTLQFYCNNVATGHTVVYNNGLCLSTGNDDYDYYIIGPYELTVGGVQVTAANAANITGTDITTGTVSFDATTNTLTLNEATINGQIESNMYALKVHLVGQNTITPEEGDAPFVYNGETGSLTFETEWASDEYGMWSLGSLTINGITQTQGSITEGYTISNALEDDFPGYIDPDEADNETTGWKKTYGEDYTQIWKFEVYDLWIGTGRVISTALEAGQSGGFLFNPATQALVAQGWTSYPIHSKLEELVIVIDGDASLTLSYDNESAISYTGNEGTYGKLKFVKAANADMASLTLEVTGSDDKAISGFRAQDITIEEPLQLKTPSSMDNILNASTVTIANYSESYDISIAGTTVTDGNADDVFGDGTVSYDNTSHTLTLNGATIEPEEETSGIVYSGAENLTIALIGNNSIQGAEGCTAIACYGEEPLPALTFVKGDNAQHFSLTLIAQSEDDFIDGFQSSDTGEFYVFDEEDDGTFTETISDIVFGGTGSAEEPFLIKSADDLRKFMEYWSTGYFAINSHVKLNNDIDCEDEEGFTTIGDNTDATFYGVFDGNHKTISNLTMTGSGLFGYVSKDNDFGVGTIKDLTLSNFNLTGNDYATGGIVAELSNGGIVSNCTVVNSTIACSNNQYNPEVGGIVARLYSSTVTGCTVNNVQVKAETNYTVGSGPASSVGGIVGNASAGTVDSCVVKNGSKITNYYADENATLNAGAIVGSQSGTTFSENFYNYDVTVEMLNGTIAANKIIKSGYSQRGVGGKTYNEQTEEDEDNPDVFDNNGAVMYTKLVTLPEETSEGSVMGKDSTYYSTVVESDVLSILVAPGQTATISVMPNPGYAIKSLTATNTSTNTAITTVSEDMGDNITLYTFTMPDDSVIVAAAFAFDISSESYTATIADATYTGSALVPTTVTLTPVDDGESIVLTNTSDVTDFTISGYQITGGAAVESPVNVGTYTVTIVGTGNYTGTREVSYTIIAATATLTTVPQAKTLTYTGAAQELVTAGATSDGTLQYKLSTDESWSANIPKATNQGTYTVSYKVVGDDNHTDSNPADVEVTIAAKTMTSEMVALDLNEEIVYSGTPKKPSVSVYDDTNALMQYRDYTISYTDSINAGEATAIVVGMGNYSGTVYKYYTINQATLTVAAPDSTIHAGDTFNAAGMELLYQGFVNGEDKTVLTTQPTATIGEQDITTPGEYTINVSGGVAANYVFDYVEGTLTVNRLLNISFDNNQWATYCATEDLATPDGLQAYQVTNVNGTVVTAAEVDYIPANTAVLLKKEISEVTLSAAAYTGQTASFADNMLLGTVAATDVNSISGGRAYVLYNDEFVVASNGTITANRGYLVISENLNVGGNGRLTIIIDGEATGLSNVNINDNVNENLNFNDKVYDMQGRPVAHPKSGQLYIRNGKKFIKK